MIGSALHGRVVNLEAVSPSTPRRLLVVEPDSRWLEMVVSIGAWYFDEVVSAADLDLNQQSIAQHSCCAAVVDYRAGFGLSLYEQARRCNPQLLYILTSSDLRVALSDPLFRFLRKPFQADELSSLLRSIAPVGRSVVTVGAKEAQLRTVPQARDSLSAEVRQHHRSEQSERHEERRLRAG